MWNNLSEFHFWSQKVLPAIYDDSISYYEVLCKVVDYLNRIIDNENEIYGQYAPLIQKVNELEASYSHLSQTLTSSVTELNRRCNVLEEDLADTKINFKAYVDNIRDGLQNQIDTLDNSYNALYAFCISLRSLIETGDAVVFQKSKAYTDNEILKLKKQLAGSTSIIVVNPVTGEPDNIQNVINQLFDYISFAAFTCREFDERGYTCEYLDSLGYTALEFDVYGKFIFIFGRDYVTTEMLEAEYVKRVELEHYALKTDLEPFALKSDLVVYNPVNGFKNTIQQVINTLVAFHACGNNCYTLDGLEYTATQYDGIGFTAFQFDFIGLVKRCGMYISPVTGELTGLQTILNQLAGLHQMGVTATEFDSSINVDCDTLDEIEYTAFDFDYYGLSTFAGESLLSVTTGITAEEWNDIYVRQDRSLVLLNGTGG